MWKDHTFKLQFWDINASCGKLTLHKQKNAFSKCAKNRADLKHNLVKFLLWIAFGFCLPVIMNYSRAISAWCLSSPIVNLWKSFWLTWFWLKDRMVMCLIASLWAPFLTLLILLQLPLKICTIKPLSLYLLHWPLRTSRGVTSYCHDEEGGYQMLPPLRAPPWARTHALQRARQPEGFSLSIH